MAEPTAERLARLEERVSAMDATVRGLTRDVRELREERAAARAIAHEAARSTALRFALAGLALTVLNIGVAVYFGAG